MRFLKENAQTLMSVDANFTYPDRVECDTKFTYPDGVECDINFICPDGAEYGCKLLIFRATQSLPNERS